MQLSTELAGQILEEQVEFTLTEFCTVCAVEERQIAELVEEGVISTTSMTQWRFSGDALRRARISLRLQRDLRVNVAGTAVVLDLLEHIATLERRLEHT